MVDVGLDIGSRFVKVVVNKGDGFKKNIIDTIEFYKKYVKRKDNDIYVDFENFLDENVKIVATGYGRNIMSFKNATIVSEIKAHFKGAVYQTGCENFTLIDIGGQDTKVIFVKNGYIEDFVMNDKCAASTGRFLENAANVLGVGLTELSNAIFNPVKLNSTCAIFSESEIIGKIAEGYDFLEIAAGVNESIARRIFPMVRRYKNDKYFISGGVGLFKGVVYFLEKLLDAKIEPLEDPQFNGAIGCLCLQT